MKNDSPTPSSRLNISSGTPWESIVGYSRAVKTGPLVEVAGTTAMIDGKAQHKGDGGAQTKVILGIIKKTLEEAGASLEQVVRTRIFVTDIGQWEAIGKAHGEFFSNIRPAATMVEVTRLIDPDLLVEIEVTAWIG